MSLNYYLLEGPQLWRLYKQHFKQLREARHEINHLQRLTNMLESLIESGGKKKGLISSALSWVIGNDKKSGEDRIEEAFSKLDVFERIVYYCWVVDWLSGKINTDAPLSGKMSWTGLFRSTGFLERLVDCTIEAEPTGRLLLNNLPLNLQCYLVRKSRSTEELGIVFEPLSSQLQEYRIVLLDMTSFQECFVVLNLLVERCHKQKLQCYKPNQSHTKSFSQCLQESAVYCTPPRQVSIFGTETSVIRPSEQQKTPITRAADRSNKSLKQFRELMPNCDLDELIGSEESFRELVNNPRFRLLQNVSNSSQLKFVTKLKAARQLVVAVLGQSNEMLWNGEVQLSETVSVKDASTYVVYQKLRGSRLDFLCYRHCFGYGTADMFLDKSVEADKGVARGNVSLRLIWVQNCQSEPNCCWLSAISEVHYGGGMALEEEIQLTQKYLLEMLDLEAYCKMKEPTLQTPKNTNNRQHTINNADWSVDQYFTPRKNNNSFSNHVEQSASEDNSIACDLELFKSATSHSDPNPNYLTMRHTTHPLPNTYRESREGWSLWGEGWHLAERGVACFQSQKLIPQSNYYKFLLPNMLSDRPKMAPPIEICSPVTLLEQISHTLALAPLLLERAMEATSTVERFKHCTSFCLSIGLLSLRIDIPLKVYPGQTHQCWLNGCPLYLEVLRSQPQPQVAIYMEGRGYKLYGTYKQQIQYQSNELFDSSEADYVIEFNSGSERVHVRPPPMSCNGLVGNERILTLRDNGYCFDEARLLFAEMSFSKKGFWSFKQPVLFDSLEGDIRRTNREFMDKFVASGKKSKPLQSGLPVGSCCRISGRWTQGLLFDGIEYYNANSHLPCVLERQEYPLPSDTSLREDLKALALGNFILASRHRQRIEALHHKLK